jgi:uncharacterized oxidoreductase
MPGVPLDIEDASSIAGVVVQSVRRFPTLHGVTHNAGIIATNLLGPIRLDAAQMPQLLEQPRATIRTVPAGHSVVPLASTPTDNATKAAIDSYTQSLRYQLRDTAMEVLELIPPHVQTELQGAYQASDPRAMPLRAFIGEVIWDIA